MDKRISRKIYIYSFVMSMVIVLYHFNIDYIYGVNISYRGMFEEQLFSYWKSCLDGLASLSVGYFFVSSAFLLYYNLTEDNFRQKIIRRCKSLVIPYVAWNSISYVVEFLINGSFPQIDGKVDLIDRLFLNPFDGPLWFMFVLLLFLIVSPILLKLRNYPRILWAGVAILYVLALVFSMFGYCKIFPYYVSWFERFFRYAPIYFSGAVVGLLHPEWVFENKVEKHGKYILGVYLILLALAVLNVNMYLTWCIFEIAPMLVWFAFDKDKFQRTVSGRYKISFMLYAAHWVVIRVAQVMLQYRIGGMGVVVNCYIGIGMQVISAIIVYFIIMLFDKLMRYMPKLHGILAGYR